MSLLPHKSLASVLIAEAVRFKPGKLMNEKLGTPAFMVGDSAGRPSFAGRRDHAGAQTQRLLDLCIQMQWRVPCCLHDLESFLKVGYGSKTGKQQKPLVKGTMNKTTHKKNIYN